MPKVSVTIASVLKDCSVSCPIKWIVGNKSVTLILTLTMPFQSVTFCFAFKKHFPQRRRASSHFLGILLSRSPLYAWSAHIVLYLFPYLKIDTSCNRYLLTRHYVHL